MQHTPVLRLSFGECVNTWGVRMTRMKRAFCTWVPTGIYALRYWITPASTYANNAGNVHFVLDGKGYNLSIVGQLLRQRTPIKFYKSR